LESAGNAVGLESPGIGKNHTTQTASGILILRLVGTSKATP